MNAKNDRKLYSTGEVHGKLREVALGNFCGSLIGRSDNPQARRVLQKEILEKTIPLAGKTFEEAWPELYRGLVGQTETLAEVLESHGIKVVRPSKTFDQLTSLEKADDTSFTKGGTTQYPRNDWLLVENHLLEGGHCATTPFLRSGIFGWRDVLWQKLKQAPDVVYAATPPVTLVDLRTADVTGLGILMESSSDVFHIGKHLYVAQSGNGTNEAGLDVVRRYFAPLGFTIEPIYFTDNVLHMDTGLAFVKEGLLMGNRRFLKSPLPKSLEDWTFVEIPFEDVIALASNGIAIDEETYVMDGTRTTAIKALEKHAVQVIPVDFDWGAKIDGGIRCSTNVLLKY